MADRTRKPHRSLVVVVAFLLVASGAIVDFGAVAQPVAPDAAPPGRTTWESPRPDWAVETPVVSGDGRWVAFQSASAVIVPDDTNGVRDIFLLELATGAVTRVSVATDGTQANGPSGNATNLSGLRGVDYDPPAISDDGRYVAFQSAATNLVTGDTNGQDDVFVHDRGYSGPSVIAPSTRIVSRTAGGASARGASRSPSISGCPADSDQTCAVAFVSDATDLPGAPAAGGRHLYRTAQGVGVDVFGPTDVTERWDCSDATPPVVLAADAGAPSIEWDASSIAFTATVEGDAWPSVTIANGECDLVPQSVGTPRPDGPVSEPVLVYEGEGVTLVVSSTATNLIDGESTSGSNVFLLDGSEPELLSTGGDAGRSHAPTAADAALATWVAYATDPADPTAADARPTVTVTRPGTVAVWRHQVPLPAAYGATTPSLGRDDDLASPVEVRLVTAASTPVVAGSPPARSVLFSAEVATNAAAPIPIDGSFVPSEPVVVDPSLSDDGTWVAFASADRHLVPGDLNASSDVFVRNIDTGALVRISVATDGTERVGGAAQPAISADGRYVAFAAAADFAHSGADIEPALMWLDARGRFVGPNGVLPADVIERSNIYVRDRDADADGVLDEPDPGATSTVLLSQAYENVGGVVSPTFEVAISRRPDITPDGRHVTFESDSRRLAQDGSLLPAPPVGEPPRTSVFSHDRDADGNGTLDEATVPVDPAVPAGPKRPGIRTSLLSVGWRFDLVAERLVPAPAGANSSEPVVSATGRYVAFTTAAENLLPGGAPTCELDGEFDPRPASTVCPADQHPDGYTFAADQGENDVVIVDRDPDGDGVLDGGAYVPRLDRPDSIDVEVVSKAADGANLPERSTSASISDDGNLVTFVTPSPGVVTAPSVPANRAQVYLRDVAAGTNELISAGGTGATVVAGDRDSDIPSISANGKMVAFRSYATNLTAGDADGYDAFVRDRRAVARRTVVASVSTAGEPGVNAFLPGETVPGAGPTGTTIDGVGRRVGFETDSTNFDPRDLNGVDDVYVRTWLPDLVLRPDPVDFGTVDRSRTSATQPVELLNRGFGPIRITGQELTGPDVARFAAIAPGFACTGTGGIGRTLDRDDTCTVTSLTFSPTEEGPRAAVLTVLTQDLTIRPAASMIGVGRIPPTDPPTGDKPGPGPGPGPGPLPEPTPDTTTTTTTTIPPVVLSNPPFVDVSPNVTLAGRTVEVRGGSFPPNSLVELHWSVGIPTVTTVRTDSLGSFTTTILLLPNDFVGPRNLEAIWVGGPPATDELLVVRGTVDRDFVSRR